MKLIWHIIRKDIVRDRWALLVWALLFVGQVVIGVMVRNLGEIDDDQGNIFQLTNVGLVGLQIIMGYILVARLVHADALIGSSVFWLTRPISAARLFLAKALGAILLFGILPVLLLLPWWLYCAFGWREIFWSGVDVFGWQLLLIAPAFLVASLTDDLGRVLLWSLLLVIGLISWLMVLQAFFGPAFWQPVSSNWQGMMYTRIWLSSVVLMIGGGAIAAHQFLTRHFVRSVVLTVCVLGLIALIGMGWHWNWGQSIASLHRPPLPGFSGLREQVRFAMMPSRGTYGWKANQRKSEAKDASLRLFIQVHGLPDDLTVVVETASESWTWSDQMTLRRTNQYTPNFNPAAMILRRKNSLPIPKADDETDRWYESQRNIINERRIASGLPITPFRTGPQSEDRIVLSGYTTLPNSMLAKMRAEPPAYRVDLHCLINRPSVVAEMPFVGETRMAAAAQTYRFLQPNADQSLLITTQQTIGKMGLWFSADVNKTLRNWFYRPSIMTMNRVTGDIRTVRDKQKGSQEYFIAGVGVSRNYLLVSPRQVIREGKETVMDPQWREHTSLVVMEPEELARLDGTVSADKFALQPDPKDQASDSSEL